MAPGSLCSWWHSLRRFRPPSGKSGIELVLEDLTRQNAEQRELLKALSETWHANNQRQHVELTSVARTTASEQAPYNVQGHLDESRKALAIEVRMLLGEVGKLREERRAIQHELGLLMMMKAKYSPGGDFCRDLQPPSMGGDPPSDVPRPPPSLPDDPPVPEDTPHPIHAGWRPVDQWSTRRIRKQRKAPPPQTEPDIPPQGYAQSWATWFPSPDMAPSPPSVEAVLVVPRPQSPGLFGPRSPRSFR